MAERRAIIKCVNRGRAVDEPRDAVHAVAVARQQQRFWRRAWIVGPLLALALLGRGWETVVANAVLSTAVLGAMSFYFWRRANTAEEVNLALIPTRRPKGGGGRKGKR